MSYPTKAFIIAGTRSGDGKTTVTLGIIEALRARGLVVQPFKAGPDYIDPGLHSAVCRRASYNLDTWMMGSDGARDTFTRNLAGTDVAVVEGVMGLFDGKDGRSEVGSTAHLAKVLGLPVLLVVDAGSMARSAGAVVKGFESFDQKLNIFGVIFNRVGSERHLKMLKDAVKANSKVRVLGCIPKGASRVLPERHLGLVTAGGLKKGSFRRFVKSAGTAAENHIDIDGLLRRAPKVRIKIKQKPLRSSNTGLSKTRKPVIAVARDRAFCFYYEENFEILEDFGARVIFFSPLKDKNLPAKTSGIYLGGGYPELYCEKLQENLSMREEIKNKALSGLPVYAECGGLMYLGRGLIDLEGRRYSMAGVFPWTSRMLKKRRALGYREVKLTGDCPFLKRGKVRGHEFHYSVVSPSHSPSRIKRVYRLSDKTPIEGYLYKKTLASYIHLHFKSNPSFAEGFVRACREMAQGA